jgi:hypothetical protein
MEFKGNLPSTEPSLSDWEWVKKQIAEDAPIPYDPSDPDDGPYDPNDDAAVDAFFDKATIWVGWPNPVMVQKDGVPVKPDETPVSEPDEARAKAS